MQKGFTVWFTGLSGAGKSTLAAALLEALKARGMNVECLDGDVIRTNLSKGLGFSKEDRDTNLRRIGFVANLLTRNNVACLVACVSPYRDIRREVREMIGSFVEVFVHCPLEICEQRDVKGLYARARRGEIKGFTGIDDPYEDPENAELVVHTHEETVVQSLEKVLIALRMRGFIEE
jgi:adenylylsulfate kinase